MTKHKFYPRWVAMMDRCYNQKSDAYESYGGRGIRVSEEFHNPETFIDYLETLPDFGIDGKIHLDRIENDKPYERGNLRWTDRRTQQNNRRIFKNNTSGLNGISYHSKSGRWRSFLHIKFKQVHIGLSDTIAEALKKRNDYIIVNNLPHKIQTLNHGTTI